MLDLLIVGTITSPHGVHGEVKIFPQTDDVRRFKKLKEVYLDTGKKSGGNSETEKMLLHPESVKFFKQFVIIKFKEFNSMNEVEGLRNKELLVDREHAVKLSKDEYFIADLIGLKVYRTDDSFLGELTDVLQTGANDVYVVKKEDGSEILLPAIKECIMGVDMEKRTMQVYIMPGLEE